MIENKIVKSNIYRCTEYCSNCPFLDDGKKIHLKKGRVDSIKKMLLEDLNSSFNCHKTVYNLDNNMNDTEEQDLKMCFGAYEFLRKNGKQNLQMQLASRLGIEMLKIEDIEKLGLEIGSQTRYKNSYVIEECIKHNMNIGGARTIEILKESFLKLDMFVGLKIV